MPENKNEYGFGQACQLSFGTNFHFYDIDVAMSPFDYLNSNNLQPAPPDV
jgi:hypothetical protein